MRSRARGIGAAALLVALGGCAARTPPPLPAAPRYPDFIYPALPPALQAAAGAARVDAGWRYLQSDDLRSAEREFTAAVRRSPALYPALTGAGYVDLARRDYDAALAAFGRALAQAPSYPSALVGRGQALLGLKRDDEALDAYEAAVAADPSLVDVRRRVEVLRFRSAQELVETARRAARDGRLDEARAAYRRALESSPDSAFLHRELGVVERRRGDSRGALEELRRAVDLDPSDAGALIQIGEILEQRLDYQGAASAYREAYAIEPTEVLGARIEAAAANARLATLPPEFHAIPESAEVTRGDLAALIGTRLERLLASAADRQVVITDAHDHWALPWIMAVARAGVMDPFANHTFQPGARVRRGDLAAAASRLALMAVAGDPARREAWSAAQPAIADMSPGHLGYPAVSIAVASGAMPLLEGGRFGVTEPVSGAEAIDVLDRIAALVR